MGNLGKSQVCAVLLLTFVSGACRRSEESKLLAALDGALQAGVITKSEYDAKKAALASLAALDKARDAGLLTPAEYKERQERLAGVVPVSTVTKFAPSSPVGAAIASAPAPAPVPVATLGSGVRQEHIFDSHLNLNAFDVTVPANWKFDGAFVPGSSCTQLPFPVLRMYSPDGLTEIRLMPRFDWNWSDSKFKVAHKADCLDLTQQLSAEDFLKYAMGMMQVAYVRDVPIPQERRDAYQKIFDRTNQAMAADAKRRAQMLPKNRPEEQLANQSGALAAAIGEYRNGTFMIEEQINVQTGCMHAPINWGPEAGKASSDSCSATVRVLRAPKGQLEALVKLDETEHPGARPNQDWVMKYMQYQQAVWKSMSDRAFADSNSRMQRQHDEFERGQAVRAQQHQQFLATMQEGTNRSMARAQQSANSRHAIAQDWCDYSLDRQTVTGSGGTVKISNAYTQTWTDGTGNYYQTNDPNANPNGVFKGNWTQTTQVHGDGTAK